MTSTRRNLIISPIGDTSVHRAWLSDPDLRSCVLFLIYYGDQPDFGRQDAEWYLRRKGFKWELMDYVVREHAGLLDRYANIWCPDNDILADTASINRMFELFEQYRLQLAQPGIAKGDISYQTLRRQPNVILRYTPFVEIMCPLFTREALKRVAPTFLENRSGWGLDWIWPRYFHPSEIAIIDQVGVEHAGELFRGENYQCLAKLGIDPNEEFHRTVAKFGGFDRRIHRRVLRGMPLPAVREPGCSVSLARRLAESLGLRRAMA